MSNAKGNQICTFEGCEKKVFAKMLCGGHYHQQRRGVELKPLKATRKAETIKNAVCRFGPCENLAKTIGLCNGHYQQESKGKELTPLRVKGVERRCSVEGCEKKHHSKGMCQMHLVRSKMAPCKVEGCGTQRALYSQGFCTPHFSDYLDSVDLKGKNRRICSTDECVRTQYAKGHCVNHYNALRDDNERKCSVEDCGKPHVARDFCVDHYHMFKETFTDLKTISSNHMTVEQYKDFIENVWSEKDPVTGCWVWQQSLRNTGYESFDYGQILYRSTINHAHRVTYHLFKGQLEEDKVVDHICHNTKCVNPEHLRQVTQSENMSYNKSVMTGNRIGYLSDTKEYSAFALNTEQWIYLGKFKTMQEALLAQLDYNRPEAA